MTSLFRLAVRGDLLKELRAEEERQARAVTAAAARAGELVKGIWRRDVLTMTGSRKLANTIRARVFPKGQASLGAAAVVDTRAPKILRGMVDPIRIRGKGGGWVAVPTENVPARVLGKRVTPALYEQRFGRGRLAFVELVPGRSGMLVDNDVRKRGGKRGGFIPRNARSRQRAESVPMFWLVPEVQTRRRFSLAAYEAKGVALMARLAQRFLADESEAGAVAANRSAGRSARRGFRRLSRAAR